jgi:hypothetical protein
LDSEIERIIHDENRAVEKEQVDCCCCVEGCTASGVIPTQDGLFTCEEHAKKFVNQEEQDERTDD